MIRKIAFFLLLFIITTVTLTAEQFSGLQAVYIRPTILSKEAAAEYMADIKSWGAKEVFLEAAYDNKYLHHSKLFPVMDKQTDWLQVLISEAKKNDLKVHIWIKICFWVHKIENVQNFKILNDNLEWIDLNRNGQIITADGTYEEKFFIFVNPGHPGVIETELKLIEELAAYDIDGISIDYIRMKAAGKDSSRWFGYNRYSVDQFRKQTGIDPTHIKEDFTPGSDFMKWVSFNEGLVKNIVKEISKKIDKINRRDKKNIVLSASPFTGYKSGKSSKYQNWKLWDKDNLIGLWLPMCMSINMTALENEINGIKDLRLNAPYYPVVYPGQHGSLHPPMKVHHDALMKTGVDKYAVFSYKQLKDEVK